MRNKEKTKQKQRGTQWVVLEGYVLLKGLFTSGD